MSPSAATQRLPAWAAKKSGILREASALRRVLRELDLQTVCESARCPNIGECFARTTATFMIAGNRCTRCCGFCGVENARPAALDPGEPARIAQAVLRMGLRHVVVTAVTRDDLADGGARHFAATISAVRSVAAGTRVEVLTPDFKGDVDALATVLAATPDVFNHNVETVPRLSRSLRPQASYTRSLAVVASAKKLMPSVLTKSGFMVGLGETSAEVVEVMEDLRAAGCDLLTIGQYLRPTRAHVPVVEYVAPEAFDEYATIGCAMGFRHVASGPLVRSSYHAERAFSLLHATA